MEQQLDVEQPVNTEEQSDGEFILEDVVIETVAVDGICGVY